MSEHIARPEGGGASKSVTGWAELQSVVLIHWLFNPDTGLVVTHHQPILLMEPKSGGWSHMAAPGTPSGGGHDLGAGERQTLPAMESTK